MLSLTCHLRAARSHFSHVKCRRVFSSEGPDRRQRAGETLTGDRRRNTMTQGKEYGGKYDGERVRETERGGGEPYASELA